MTNSSISINQISFSYPDGTTALHELSFNICIGESVAIIGANGAGKSTLLLHLNGCLLPASGNIKIGDIEISKRNLTEIRSMVGMVFQNPDDQLFMPTVYEDVAFGPQNMGLAPQEVKSRVEMALNDVDAVHLQNKPPYRLSGGEKRRVAIATVLSMSPEILVLDEPTTGLDALGRRQLINLLKGLDHTRILATHDLELVLELCKRVIVLHQGRIAADGPATEIFQNLELLRQTHLEQPLSLRDCPQCAENRI
jgi:cobalt/nickel transport system ATP-binding protein